MIKTIVFALIFIAAMVFLYTSLKKVLGLMKVAKAEDRSDNAGARIANVLKIAIGQSKIFRDSAAGPVHAGIFWGFLVFLFSASEGVIQGFYHGFTWGFLGPLYSLITLSTDIFCVVIIIAIVIAFLRRFVFKIERLQGDKSEVLDATIVLGAIFTITVSLLIQNAAHSVLIPGEAWAIRPVSSAIGASIISLSSAGTVYEVCWWIHIITILGFANFLPYSKHFHVYTSIPNVYFGKLGFPNSLETIDFEDESIEKFGVVDIDDLSWKNILDSYSCTHCGRCASVCPANTTGKELSPREIIVQMRERTVDAAAIILKLQDNPEAELTEDEQKVLEKRFVGDYESTTALWQCTTCGACMQECPVSIEHVPVIVGMRRNLVMMESDFPAELQSSFGDLENNATPWSFSQEERADWAEGLEVPTAAEKQDFDVLFWVGCAGSYDDRAKKISMAFSKLLNEAGVNYAILGTEEMCNGDIARRTGNEYLADMLVKTNIETMSAYDVKKIVTICPHCFNTFKNDYPLFGAEYEVIPHSEFLNQLIKEGKLKLKGNGARKVAYHDSCYLGRYNGIFEAPRNTIKSVPGLSILEPGRTGDKGFCCGAGGGQMFMEETEGKRVNIERTEELLATGADTIAANCPFCMTMLTDGVKALDKENIEVKDIAEIILENLDK